MKDTIRDSALGMLIRLASGKRLLRYPEEHPDFQNPYDRWTSKHNLAENDKEFDVDSETEDPKSIKDENSKTEQDTNYDVENAAPHTQTDDATLGKLTSIKLNGKPAEMQTLRERYDADLALIAQRKHSIPIEPEITASGQILVTWYTTDDPENPQNWSQKKKSYIVLVLWVYTFIVYASSSIFVSSVPGVMQHFDVGEFKASLGLALFVLGYGVGPLIFSPISEIPVIGRNFPYVISFGIFVILSVPTALVKNLGGLLVLRFLQGFFGSPCLATGPATLQDIYSLLYLPIAVSTWVSGAFAAPAMGPLISGYAVMAKGWRWSLWEILWMAGPVFILWFLTMPETLADNILLRRAKRLRKLTGNNNYVAQSELNQANMTLSEVVQSALVKPFEINIKDPAVLFTSIYSGIIYGTYYSFFEAYPIVYGGIYGFSIGAIGLVFVCIAIGAIIGMTMYDIVILKKVIPDILKHGMSQQEEVLKLALVFVFGPTLSLFLFAWTARADIHWIVPTVMLTIYPISIFIVFQAIFSYIPLTYPQYAASLFAGNDFVRSFFAFGSVLFSRPMYVNLGIGKGVSLLGGLSVLGWIGMYYLYFRGAKLRSKSKFALHAQ